MRRQARSQSGQVMVLVAVSLIALIGSAALVLVAGSAEWQKNQLQQVADQAALEAALKISIGCDAAKAKTVIDTADTSIGLQRTPTGAYTIAAGGSCASGYSGSQTFSNGTLSAAINYPYRAHQQQVEVILTLTLPISFGSVVGSTSTKVIRRAVAQALPGSVPALSATTLMCTGGQVNVAGSLITQAVTLSNNCALYAHTRFDVTSSTYSDLGNASVYTDNQMWIVGSGSCRPSPTNAICADGYELSGHVTPTCGTTSASAFLSVGDAAVNPNPCAPGVARPPVPPIPPLSTNMPPEPNTDPTAIAQLVGPSGAKLGAACAPLGTPPTISVKGKVVGTSFATPPTIPDAKGFYHFKPSCYGYLDPSSLSGGGGGITNKQTGPEVGPATSTVKVTLPGASTVGTLLVVVLRSDTNPSDKPFAPNPVAGWISAITGGAFVDGAAHTEIWYYPNNPGAIAQWNFDVSPNSLDAVGQMTEWSGVAASALDASGTFLAAANQTSVTVKTSTATTLANDLVITDIGAGQQSPQTYTGGGAGWTNLASDMSIDGFASDYSLSLPAGAAASETVTVSNTTEWASMIAAFKPAGGGGGGAGAVLDPGFYYFNGWDGVGYTGGGICLNGGTLLAQTTTLEFVNKAGFSSGDCTVGGGATACSSPCQFGSGSVADSTFTYFSAPCSQAPAGDSSCPGPGWCTNGDRACMNMLIWSSSAGEIAIKGANANHWLLGSIYWPGTCTDTVNGTSTIAGTLSCGSLSISAGVGVATAIGGDYGIATSLVEAILVE
jgi:Putative Flp pilus-assembly TadE/G-like